MGHTASKLTRGCRGRSRSQRDDLLSRYLADLSRIGATFHKKTQRAGIETAQIQLGDTADTAAAEAPRPVKVTPHVRKYLPTTPGFVHCVFELETGKKAAKTARQPFDLCVVLDTSGSMAGSKLNHARDAISLMISSLQPEDRMHLVTYDSNVRTIFHSGSSTNERSLQKQMQTLRADSCTNISAGLMEGFRLLGKHSRPGVGKRIFLFSDGQVNEGLIRHDELFRIVGAMQEQGVNTTTFGLGSHFDEVVMQGIAEHGHGQYIFISDAEDIPGKVNLGLKALQGLVASECTLRVVCPDHVLIHTAYAYTTLDTPHGAVLGDMSEEDRRQVVMKLKVNPPKHQSEGRRGRPEECPVAPGGMPPPAVVTGVELLQWELTYVDVDNAERRVREAGVLCAVGGCDDDRFGSEADPALVSVYATVAEVSDKDTEVHRLLQHSNEEGRQQALTLKGEVIRDLERVVGLDTTGNVGWLLARAKTTLATIEQSRDYERMRKDVGYEAYLGSHGLAEAGLI